ncbi:hypothetical protein A9Q99_01080 [Gammaproteobacteria bacterium 45_16_T64]|nr:hypothetical protein A9Q99_01080 [Gammaproteobacteria bacterium 45_16_T64]
MFNQCRSIKFSAYFLLFSSLFACTNMQEQELMWKVVFVDSVDESTCILVEEITCKTIRVNSGDVCTPWFQKRAVRKGGTHVIKEKEQLAVGDVFVGASGVSAGKASTGKSTPGKIYKCQSLE